MTQIRNHRMDRSIVNTDIYYSYGGYMLPYQDTGIVKLFIHISTKFVAQLTKD